MTRILEFRIDGLAGRKDPVSIHLNPDVNVFWGMNGSGKTSLLRILHSALTGDAAPLVRVPFEKATVVFHSELRGRVVRSVTKSKRKLRELDRLEDALSGRDDPELYANAQFELLESANSLQWATEPEELDGRGFSHGYLPISRITERGSGFGDRRPPRRELLDEAAYDQAFADAIDSLWQRHVARSSMVIREVQQRGLADVLDVVLNPDERDDQTPLVDPRAGFTLVTNFLQNHRLRTSFNRKDFLQRYGEDGQLRAIVGRISEVQRGIEIANLPQRRLQDILSAMMSGNKAIDISGRRLTIRAGDVEIPVTGLSSGEKQLLLLLLETANARQNSVIVDEPELSLHVDWQQDLIENMRVLNSEAQVIIATHSPEVMANVPDREIFEL
ncbi:AAA family ATPase [Georgenia ruanii]|nr:AAA family ATPase [Georgenia ruanii]